MFQIHDYINYQSKGICKLEDITNLKLSQTSKPRRYYVLRPVYNKNAAIYVPVDNQKLTNRMRKVLSKEEIDDIILHSKDIELKLPQDHKQRAEQFRQILNRHDESELLKMIRCLYLKSQQGHLTSTDSQLMKKAEEIIEQAFSFALKTNIANIGAYIQEKLNESTMSENN